MINLVIMENNGVLREGLKYLFDQTEGYKCIAVFNDFDTMLSKLQHYIPDVILIDIDISVEIGLTCIKNIKESYPEILIIVLSNNDNCELVYKALYAGASGFLSQNIPPGDLIAAIQDVHKGGAPLSSSASKKLVEFFHRNSFSIIYDEEYNLTSREKEVIRDLIEGKNIKEIASQHFISIETVRFHFKNIFRKLKVRNQAELVTKVLREYVL